MTKVLDTVGEYKQIQTPSGPKWINANGDSCSDPRASIRPATRDAHRMTPQVASEAAHETAEAPVVATVPEAKPAVEDEPAVRRKNDSAKTRRTAPQFDKSGAIE